MPPSSCYQCSCHDICKDTTNEDTCIDVLCVFNCKCISNASPLVFKYTGRKIQEILLTVAITSNCAMGVKCRNISLTLHWESE